MPIDLFQTNNISVDNNQPKDLFQEHGISVDDNSQIPQIPDVPQGFMDKLNANPLFQGILGASDETNNMLRNALNMLPGVKLQQMQSGSGTAYNIGKIGGDIGAFSAGGEGLEAASGAAKIIPYLSKIAQFIGKPIANSAIVGGTIGGLQNPDDKLQNAALGALLGGGGQAAFEGAKAIPSILQKLRPMPIMSEALEKIPQKFTEENLKAQENYRPIFEKFGNLPVETNKLTNKTLNRPELKDFYNRYKENPTINNAHILQSQAQSSARSITKGDAYSNEIRASLFNNADALKDAIKKSLGSNAQDYENADLHFRNNVIPYKMLSNNLGKLITSQKNPQTVVNTIEKTIKNKGYPDINIGTTKVPIIPDDVQQYITKLNSTIKNKKSLQKLGIGVGATGAGLEGYHLIKSLFGGEQ